MKRTFFKKNWNGLLRERERERACIQSLTHTTSNAPLTLPVLSLLNLPTLFLHSNPLPPPPLPSRHLPGPLLSPTNAKTHTLQWRFPPSNSSPCLISGTPTPLPLPPRRRRRPPPPHLTRTTTVRSSPTNSRSPRGPSRAPSTPPRSPPPSSRPTPPRSSRSSRCSPAPSSRPRTTRRRQQGQQQPTAAARRRAGRPAGRRSRLSSCTSGGAAWRTSRWSRRWRWARRRRRAPRTRATAPEILSPSVLDFPSLRLSSPVTPLTGDPFNRSPASTSSSSEEAERAAIAERGFFLHPSPRGGAEPPRLLPLFPVTSPRMAAPSEWRSRAPLIAASPARASTVP